MKLTICITAIMLVGLSALPVCADRVILAPTGTTLASGEIRAEAAIDTTDSNTRIYWVGIGLQRLEIGATRFENGNEIAGPGDTNVLTAEISILPDTTLTPGVGVGAWDISSETPDGAGYYLALTKVLPFSKDLPSPIRDIRLHAGVGSGAIAGFFAGAEASLPFGLRVAADYFREDFNFSLGWKALPGLQIKAYLLNGESHYGLQFSPPL